MTEIAASVKQQGYTTQADQSGSSVRTLQADREGALFTGDISSKYRQWLLAGNIHMTGGGDSPIGLATIENNTSLDLTEPIFLMDVPSSKVVVPIMIKVAPAVVWETGDEYALYASNATGYSAGGDDLSAVIENAAVEGSGDSEISATAITSIYDGDAALTMAAVSDVRVIDAGHFLTGELGKPYEYNVLKGDVPVYLHGVSSLALAIARTTTTAEAFITAVWAELDKTALVNS